MRQSPGGEPAPANDGGEEVAEGGSGSGRAGAPRVRRRSSLASPPLAATAGGSASKRPRRAAAAVAAAATAATAADERGGPAAATPSRRPKRTAAAAAAVAIRADDAAAGDDDVADADDASPQRGGRLSLLRIAEILLSREQQPMTAQQVIDMAIAEGMYKTKSKKPKNSLATVLSSQRAKVRSGEIPCTFFHTAEGGKLEYNPEGRG